MPCDDRSRPCPSEFWASMGRARSFVELSTSVEVVGGDQRCRPLGTGTKVPRLLKGWGYEELPGIQETEER